eukprot:CAMPEP_0204822004 /NCGR_PEP_ID=MMETSP1346-20131115/197_1 /ASSEMBLY_ACC=CAM_ASM_000771 /TAXON_ID=215587 /ORGANISM="Aplanochytrium stocchinoi, Strain GSBS06" /LENGTH=225 /DNA_ID=CAMNT_0051948003 /DNA_START=361 /DNA_END=1038 /DNA_ORIENTATION=+
MSDDVKDGVRNPNCWHQKIMEKHCHLQEDPENKNGERKFICKTIEKLLEKCPGKEMEEIERTVVESEEDRKTQDEDGKNRQIFRSRGDQEIPSNGFDEMEKDLMERFGQHGFDAGRMMDNMLEQFLGGVFGGFSQNRGGGFRFGNDSFPVPGDDNDNVKKYEFRFQFPPPENPNSKENEENSKPWMNFFRAPHHQNQNKKQTRSDDATKDEDTRRREAYYETNEI